ncbi:MAG: Uma2 family endonuclease [Anaerolineales bacterium]|nr:Uma2 family endonuclease [Anaerolineales bacterium]
MEKVELTDRKAPPVGKVTFEEFLAWADEDTFAEWEDGEVIMASPASRRHQDLNVWLASVLSIFVRQRKLGWLTSAPFLTRLRVTDQGREPDLVFLKTEHLDRLQETYLEGPADLVVEIVSLESVSRDRGRKFVEYESEGIPEYWLIDPIRRQAEFYHLSDDRHYHLALPDAEGVYHSLSVAGFWLRVDWLWQDPLPDELDVLREVGIG